jgi:hypothetical protein
MLNPRGQQILLCIRQLIKESQGIDLPVYAYETTLVSSIQRKTDKGIWPLFKRIVREHTLDREDVAELSLRIFKGEKEVYQPEFDF